MKIVVYAICCNEAQFVDRWVDAMSEADEIVVLDTGSKDDTVERLRKRGVFVIEEHIVPWRFDHARNRSLELVPKDADLCVCTDLDEVFRPGWRTLLEKAWKPGITQVSYRYTWSFQEDGQEGVVFWIEKIHVREGYQWRHPVHEVLQWVGKEKPGEKIFVEGIQLNHYPDAKKSRQQYLPLLELAVQEDPQDDRNVHYLGREYLYQRQWDACIAMLQKHLAMPSAVWADERAASMRYIAQAYYQKGEKQSARNWYLQAIAQASYLREPYLDLAWMLYREEQWEGVLYFTQQALEITERSRTYMTEAQSWGSLPYDLRAMAFYNTGRYQQALSEASKALQMEPTNERLQKNKELLKILAER